MDKFSLLMYGVFRVWFILKIIYEFSQLYEYIYIYIYGF